MNKLLKGDCLTLLKDIPDNSIDCIITDPPYGMDYQSSMRASKFAKILNDKFPFIWFLHDAYRVLKDNSCILSFCRWDSQEAFKLALEWAGFTVKGQIIWDKEAYGMGDLKGTPAPSHEVIWFATKGKYKLPNKRPKDLIKCSRVSGSNLTHPNEKPVELYKQLINSYTKENEILLDCFIGSGAFAQACIETNRNFIGMEMDDTYYAIAKERIENTLNTPTN